MENMNWGYKHTLRWNSVSTMKLLKRCFYVLHHVIKIWYSFLLILQPKHFERYLPFFRSSRSVSIHLKKFKNCSWQSIIDGMRNDTQPSTQLYPFEEQMNKIELWWFVWGQFFNSTLHLLYREQGFCFYRVIVCLAAENNGHRRKKTAPT